MNTAVKVLLAAMAASALLAAGPGVARASGADGRPADPEAARLEELKKENELLRKENQALRRQVVALRSRLGASEAEKAGADAARGGKDIDSAAKDVKPDGENEERWLSGSGRRHNSSCRYFKTGNGRLCSEKDGAPCKVCGG